MNTKSQDINTIFFSKLLQNNTKEKKGNTISLVIKPFSCIHILKADEVFIIKI